MGILTFQKNVHLPRVILHEMTPESLKSAQPSRSSDAERTDGRTDIGDFMIPHGETSGE